MIKWLKRLLALGVALVLFVLLVVVPVGGSFLITDMPVRPPDLDSTDPESLGLGVTPVEFTSEDGVGLKGWWNPGEPDRPIIVFVHGLNRSRLELLERAVESHLRGYGVLLFDLRNHGESDSAQMTLGVHESRDVCAARAYVKRAASNRQVVLWGVSLGASTALLASGRCRGFGAVIADSSFLSLEETVSHHFRLLFGLPSFPIANLLIHATRFRAGFDLAEGDVERVVQSSPDLPILFIAGDQDVRMPPEIARQLYDASAHPDRKLLIVPGAAHGRAFREDRQGYLRAVFDFLDGVFPETKVAEPDPA